MKRFPRFTQQTAVNFFKTAAILGAATAVNGVLHDYFSTLGNSVELYILSVLLISLNTTGYVWGILGAFAGVLCVNYFFTFPFTNFNFTLEGYPLSFVVMLTVSVSISTLSGRVKKQREFAKERTRLIEAQQNMQIETEKEKMRGNLLRAISHDLRTPLTGILSASGVLIDSRDMIDEKGRIELLNGIHEDAEWLLRMVENVLSVTRISGGAPSLHKVSEPLDEVFSQVAAKARKRFPEIQLTMHIPEQVTMVPMDEMLIVQVLVNLVDNAIRHGGGEKVELYAQNEPGQVRITVRDHGRGIPLEDLDKLFEGFGVRDKPSSDATRGLGIGLSICRTIVEGHGGQISACNSSDGGACVSFTLPIEEVRTNYAEQ